METMPLCGARGSCDPRPRRCTAATPEESASNVPDLAVAIRGRAGARPPRERIRRTSHRHVVAILGRVGAQPPLWRPPPGRPRIATDRRPRSTRTASSGGPPHRNRFLYGTADERGEVAAPLPGGRGSQPVGRGARQIRRTVAAPSRRPRIATLLSESPLTDTASGGPPPGLSATAESWAEGSG